MQEYCKNLKKAVEIGLINVGVESYGFEGGAVANSRITTIRKTICCEARQRVALVDTLRDTVKCLYNLHLITTSVKCP